MYSFTATSLLLISFFKGNYFLKYNWLGRMKIFKRDTVSLHLINRLLRKKEVPREKNGDFPSFMVWIRNVPQSSLGHLHILSLLGAVAREDWANWTLLEDILLGLTWRLQALGTSVSIFLLHSCIWTCELSTCCSWCCACCLLPSFHAMIFSYVSGTVC